MLKVSALNSNPCLRYFSLLKRKMRDPKRILKKLIEPGISIAPFEASGESLEQAVETFRDVVQCRKIRDFIKITGSFLLE